MTNSIEDVLKSGEFSNCSNIQISPSIKSRLVAIKDEKQQSQTKRIKKLKEKICKIEHKAFVKCVEWARTCDPVDLSGTGVM